MELTSPSLATTLLALYYCTLGVLAIYGAHRLWLVFLYQRSRRLEPAEPSPPEVWPRVTVQLPLYNELYVAARLIDAVCRLDYPRDRLEIQVLDDSTDETTRLVARSVAEHRERGVDIHHLHRTDRRGFKAGALAAGLEKAKGEFLAVFDADFVPDTDFLTRTIPHFQDPGIGMVQARWEHINRGYSLLTRIQAMLLDGHFVVEHTARHRSGRFFNFNGTAGIWRRRVIDEAGGWQHDTLTEDLDLSYRAQLAGWRFLYLPRVAVPSELPVDVNGFKSQQYRWARGSIQTGRKLLGRILKADLPFKVKAEALVHLTNNLSYPLMVLLSLLVFPAMVLRRGSEMWMVLAVDLPLFISATVSVLIFYIVSQSIPERNWRRQIRYLPALMGLGVGLAVNNSRAVFAGMARRGGVFHRTPKYKIENRGQSWRDKRYRVGRNLSLAVEAAMAVYLGSCLVWATSAGMWLSLPFLYLFFHGYLYIVALTLLPGSVWGEKSEPPPLPLAGAAETPAMEG